MSFQQIDTLDAGRSVALKFAKSYAVALLARNPANYESIVKEINSAGGHAIGISTDVSSESAVKNAFAEITRSSRKRSWRQLSIMLVEGLSGSRSWT
jgi:NAD(P)-dependent dehydrogenase (short-subunit alcohol dehydrogenase family)